MKPDVIGRRRRQAGDGVGEVSEALALKGSLRSSINCTAHIYNSGRVRDGRSSGEARIRRVASRRATACIDRDPSRRARARNGRGHARVSGRVRIESLH